MRFDGIISAVIGACLHTAAVEVVAKEVQCNDVRPIGYLTLSLCTTVPCAANSHMFGCQSADAEKKFSDGDV